LKGITSGGEEISDRKKSRGKVKVWVQGIGRCIRAEEKGLMRAKITCLGVICRKKKNKNNQRVLRRRGGNLAGEQVVEELERPEYSQGGGALITQSREGASWPKTGRRREGGEKLRKKGEDN